ncbi:hypothetical protein BDW69DRAFT_71527 [Aspergillus filifer]
MANSRAVVVLHVLSLTDPFPSRSLTLDTETDYIEVGRASKRENKNLAPSPRNALFDSRVMSRTHAILRWSQEKKMIYVCDPGSMHGTWLNKNKLPLDKDVILTDGDELTFGVEVIRGTETFPPLAVRCECRWLGTPLVPEQPGAKSLVESRDTREDKQVALSMSASNTFCVPEDDEEEEEDEEKNAENAALAKYPDAVDLTTDQTSESNASEAGSDSEDGQSVIEVSSPMTSPLKNDESNRLQPTGPTTVLTQGSLHPAESSKEEIQNTEQPLATPRMTPPSPGYESEDASGENQYYDECFAHSSDEEESNHEAEDWDLDEEAEEEYDGEKEEEEGKDEDAELAEPDVIEDPNTFLQPTPAWHLEHGNSADDEKAPEEAATESQGVPVGKYSDFSWQSRPEIPHHRPMAPLYPLLGRPYSITDYKPPQHYAPRVPDINPFPPTVQKPLPPLADFTFSPPSPYPPIATYNDGPFAANRAFPEPQVSTASCSKPEYPPFMDPLAPMMPRTSCAPPAISHKRVLRDYKSSGTKRKAADLEPDTAENDTFVAPAESQESTNDDFNLPDAQPQATAADFNGTASQLTTVSLSEPAKEPEVVERPSKQAKTTHRSSLRSHAATAIVGAVVGAVGTIAALASLPPDYFA